MFQTLLLNSSFGVALMLMYRSQASGGKAQIGEKDYMHYDIFDVSKLSKDQKTDLIKLYKKLEKVEFPSLKKQYSYNNEHRRTLDVGILEILGLKKQEINSMLDKIYPVFPDEFTVD